MTRLLEIDGSSNWKSSPVILFISSIGQSLITGLPATARAPGLGEQLTVLMNGRSPSLILELCSVFEVAVNPRFREFPEPGW